MIRVRQLFRSTVLVMLFFGISKVTGLARGILVGRRFGTGDEFDAFTAANQLPELFFVLIAGGALAAAFIPIYTDALVNREQKEVYRLLHSTISLVILILGLVSLLGAIFAGPLVSVLAPGFGPEKQELMADLMRVLLLQTFIFGISGVLTGFLNAHQHFALPALASVALDIGYVIGLYAFGSSGIRGLAWGTVVGAVLHVLIQAPALLKHRFTYRPILDLYDVGVREIVRLMGPRIVTLGTIQLADLFIVRLASTLAAGSTSAYFYGYFIMQLPETLFGTAIALVVFPTLSELFNAGRIEEMKETATRTLGIIWSLTIPSAVALLMLGRPMLQILFQSGAFDADAIEIVYGVVLVFSLRVVSESSLEILARLLYAQHDTLRPMFAYLIWLLVQVGGAYLFVTRFGVQGLALAATLAFTVLSIVLYFINRSKLNGWHIGPILVGAGRSLFASIVMAGVIWGLQGIVGNQYLFLISAAAIGGVVYLALISLLGGKEIQELWAVLR